MTSAETELSIVIPAHNEAESIPILLDKIRRTLDLMGQRAEVVVVDDGSGDATAALVKTAGERDHRIVLIRLRRNFGQTAAIQAGVEAARGEILVTIDADLQNDPADIPRLVETLRAENLDAVVGWRRTRCDPFSKRGASFFANALRRLITDEHIHDSGCTLRAYRRECFEDLELHGEMHRFIPSLLIWRGFRVSELVVRHHRRRFGRSHYGTGRLIRGLFDLLSVAFWLRFRTRPIHLLGCSGLLMAGLGGATSLVLVAKRFLGHTSLANRPLLLVALALALGGIQLVILGLFSELLLQLYRGHVPSCRVAEVWRSSGGGDSSCGADET